jgi:pseudouridine-5'-phosphate glycosidase
LFVRLAEVTGGASIRANRALALHNATIASELVVVLAR